MITQPGFFSSTLKHPRSAVATMPVRMEHGMWVCLHIDRSRLLRWHLWLKQALSKQPGFHVTVSVSTQVRPLPLSCRLLIELERTIYGSRGSGATDPIGSLEASEHDPRDRPDLVIDLAGHGTAPKSRRVITPSYNGLRGEVGLIASIFDRQDIHLEIRDTASPEHSWIACPASTDWRVLSASLDGVLSCTVPLILKAVQGRGAYTQKTICQPPDLRSPQLTGGDALSWAVSLATSKAAKLTRSLISGAPTWSIGWRRDLGEGLIGRHRASFSIVQGGGTSFLADPFPFRHQGKDYIFAEEYPYDTKRGVISVIPIRPDGLPGVPRVVLEEPHHLSYPFVFEHDGEIWMVPECGESGTICLYRAVAFPDQWAREAVLLDKIEAFDATLLITGERFWFFTGLRTGTSTSWDMLGLYHAGTLTGPWTPHANNPILFDATFSRPAGAVFHHDGMLLRPAQSCARGYGEAINICRIDTLSEVAFAQTPMGQIHCGSYRCHTFNRHRDLECIDIFGPSGIRDVDAIYDTSPETLRDIARIDTNRRHSLY